ncbi:MAG: helix-turn-helix transcriptional regulator [Deltaproteobacteria bacterium]|nr:helix-turn-helix transcriptional regulator [Deltaproteobacteria bacterium]
MVFYLEETSYNLVMEKRIDALRKELGRKIRELRKTAGLTQEELDEKTGLNYKFIGELERGKVNVSIDSLLKIADALNVKIEDLFRRDNLLFQRPAVKTKKPVIRLTPRDIHAILKAIQILKQKMHKI